MTIVPMTKKCTICKRKYPYNPDVGIGFFCPYCAKEGMPPKSTLEDILRRSRKKK